MTDKGKGIDSDIFLMEMGNIQRFNTLNEKLNWIARQIMKNDKINDWDMEQYVKIFDEPKPKPEEENKSRLVSNSLVVNDQFEIIADENFKGKIESIDPPKRHNKGLFLK